MTRKEFITNLLRDLGYQVVSYRSGDWVAEVDIKPIGQHLPLRTVHVWSDRSRSNLDRVSVKFKWNPYINAEQGSFRSVDLVRRTQVWLAQRGFEALADWTRYRDTSRGGVGGYTTGYLRIRSIGYPWDQCAKAMAKAEAFEDALTYQRRFKPTGNLSDISV